MKSLFTLLCLCSAILVGAQPIKTFVNSSGITLKDQAENQSINLDGIAKLIEIKVNDSLMLHIQGGEATSIKLINTLSMKEIGMEMNSDGSFSFGEFGGAPPLEFGSVLNIRNGLFRPAPDTQALATGNEERLRITPDGKIGIGTLTPVEKLDIEGGIRIGFAPLVPDIPLFPIYNLVINDDGIVFRRESPIIPDGPQQQGLIAQIKNQNRTIEALTKRLAVLEEKMNFE